MYLVQLYKFQLVVIAYLPDIYNSGGVVPNTLLSNPYLMATVYTCI